MINTLKNTLLLLTLLGGIICFQSCGEKEQGCTDPNGENYNADAEEDDGSCTYARTKMLGRYGAGEVCDGGFTNSYVVEISESSTGTNAITLYNETQDATLEGTVSGNTITINDSFVDEGATVNFSGTGTYSNDNGLEEINLDYTYTIMDDSGTIQIDCLGLWEKI